MRKGYWVILISFLLIGAAWYWLYMSQEKVVQESVDNSVFGDTTQQISQNKELSWAEFPVLMPRNAFHINPSLQTPEIIKHQKAIQISKVRFALDEENSELLVEYKKLKKAWKCRVLQDCADPGGWECTVCWPLKWYQVSYTIPEFWLKLLARTTENVLGIVDRGAYHVMGKQEPFLFSGNAIYDRYRFTGSSPDDEVEYDGLNSTSAVLFYHENRERLSVEERIKKDFPYFWEHLTSFECRDHWIIWKDISWYVVDFVVYNGVRLDANYLPMIIFNNKGSNNFIYYDGGRTNSFKKIELIDPVE